MNNRLNTASVQSMTEIFAIGADEALVKSLAATWYKGSGGLNNQTGQLILTSQRLVFCARNRLLTAAVTGPLLDQIIKSEKIRWQIGVEDIESISSFKRLGITTNYRIKSKRWDGEEFVVAFMPGSGSTLEDWASQVGFEINKEDSSTSSPDEKPLSETPKGYLLAVAGGLLGGIPGLFASPLVLLGLNNVMKANEEKRPNRFRAWALIGIIGVPVCVGIQATLSGNSTVSNQPVSVTSNSPSQPTGAPEPIPVKPAVQSFDLSVDCKNLRSEIVNLSEQDRTSRGFSLIKIYDPKEVSRSSKDVKCSGSASWSDGDNTAISYTAYLDSEGDRMVQYEVPQ